MSKALTYTAKPEHVEAMQYPKLEDPSKESKAHGVYLWVESNTDGSYDYLAAKASWENIPNSGVTINPENGKMIILSGTGEVTRSVVNPGDFVVRHNDGVFRVLTEEGFLAKYTTTEDQS